MWLGWCDGHVYYVVCNYWDVLLRKPRYITQSETVDELVLVPLKDFGLGKPIHVLDMTLGNVRPDMVGSKCRFTITMNNQRSYV